MLEIYIHYENLVQFGACACSVYQATIFPPLILDSPRPENEASMNLIDEDINFIWTKCSAKSEYILGIGQWPAVISSSDTPTAACWVAVVMGPDIPLVYTTSLLSWRDLPLQGGCWNLCGWRKIGLTRHSPRE